MPQERRLAALGREGTGGALPRHHGTAAPAACALPVCAPVDSMCARAQRATSPTAWSMGVALWPNVARKRESSSTNSSL